MKSFSALQDDPSSKSSKALFFNDNWMCESKWSLNLENIVNQYYNNVHSKERDVLLN